MNRAALIFAVLLLLTPLNATDQVYYMNPAEVEQRPKPKPKRAPSPVPKTGQTECWSVSGNHVIDCAGTGQDGEYQAGTSVPVRFTDNNDGTVLDNLTGLVWLKDANCFGYNATMFWAAMFSNRLGDGECGLSDGSAPGHWKLPNINELASLVDYGQTFPALPLGHPFFGVEFGSDRGFYWSSTTASNQHRGLMLWFGDGSHGDDWRDNSAYIWPVRRTALQEEPK